MVGHFAFPQIAGEAALPLGVLALAKPAPLAHHHGARLGVAQEAPVGVPHGGEVVGEGERAEIGLVVHVCFDVVWNDMKSE